MINKIKSMSKRTLALLLTLLMLLSSGIVGAVAVNVDLAETGANMTAGSYLYLKPNSNWTQSGAWFAMYVWGTSAATWVKMEKVDDSSATVYKGLVPAGTRDKVIFCRMNPGKTALDWASKWDQSVDLEYDGTNNCWAPNAGQWNNATGTWSTYNPPQPPAAPTTFEITSITGATGSGTEEDPYKIVVGNDYTVNFNITHSAVSTLKNYEYKAVLNKEVTDEDIGHLLGTDVASFKSTDDIMACIPNKVGEYTVSFQAKAVNAIGYSAGLTDKIWVNIIPDTVTVTPEAEEGGKVTPSSATTVNSGLPVTLKADADEAHNFAGWEITGGDYTTDNDITNDAEITIYPKGDLKVKAKFADKTNEVVVSVKPSEGGTIENTGTHTIKYGGSIDLVVTKVNDNYDFDGWYVNDVLFSEELECKLTEIKEKKIVEARFTEHDKFVVTVTQSGGEGMVTADGYLVVDNKITVYVDKTVTFHAEAPENHYISDINGTPNNDDKLIKTDFNVGPIKKATTVTIGYTELDKIPVTVTNDNTKGTLDVASKEVYKYSDLTVTAIPLSKKYKITDWKVNGELTGVSGNTYTLTSISAETEIEPVWTEVLGYTVTVKVNDPAMGRANASSALVLPGENVTVSAVANELYGFVGWSINGIQQSDKEKYTFPVNDDVTIVANFKQTHKYYYYTNSSYTVANAYAWTDATANSGKIENHGWPGERMDEFGEGIFRIKLSLEYKNVIFNNGSAQTGDLDLPGADSENNHFDGTKWVVLDPNSLPVVIFGDSGATASGGGYLGKTTFVEVIEGTLTNKTEYILNTTSEADNCYTKANITANTPVMIKTKLEEKGKDYYVEGFVINGTEFEKATLTGTGDDQAYTATYTFKGNINTVVPIYFHTKDWLKEHGVEIVEVYAKMDVTQPNWNQYMASFTWYENGYQSFGTWPGQLMIPADGTHNGYYTYVEKTDGSTAKKPIQGITFSNYGGHSDTTRLPVGKEYPVTNYYNLQVYDYYEFIELVNQGQKNITFELKTHNQTINYNRAKNFIVGTKYPKVITDYSYTEYVDSAGIPMDIYRNDVTNEEVGLYIIRSAPNYVSDSKAVGYFYVTCHLFASDGTYLGNCTSYELLELLKGTVYATLSDKIEAYTETIKGKKVMVSYESYTMLGEGQSSSNASTNYAPRLDGEWYADTEAKVWVEVAITEDNGLTYVPDPEGISGSASITWKDQTAVELTVEIGDTVKLEAFKNDEYKFIGWYDAAGNQFSNVATKEVPVTYGTYYTAVFQKLGHYEFNIIHSYYPGDTNGNAPAAKNGQGTLYVGVSKDAFITDVTQLSSSSTGSVSTSLDAYEGDKLYITIATDANDPDKFVAWYVNSLTAAGVATYEQVGMNSDSNKFNNTGNIKGSSNLVGFSFEYIVSKDRGINLYSDIEEISSYATLVYKYEDRYKNVKTYVVPNVKLSDAEILNDYIPTEATILKYAPYVDDLYTDAIWELKEKYYDGYYELWATQPKPTYTVTVNAGNGNIQTYTGMFNSVGTGNQDGETVTLELDARKINPSATNQGYWVDENGTILAYGRYFALRVTRNMTLKYVQSETPLDFDIVLDNPVYGREQYTDEKGEVKTDKIIIDYMTSIHVPIFRNDKTAGNKVVTDVYYKDNVIDSTNSPVTIETLVKHYGYSIEHYIVVEQVRDAEDYVGNNGTPTADAELFEIIKNYKKPTLNTAGDKYYVVYNTSGYTLTNKNRFLFTTSLKNDSINVKNNYNVYGCLKVTDDTGKVSYFVGDPQTLNIAAAATKEPDRIYQK